VRFAALGRPFLPELQFSPDGVIPPMLDTHLHVPLTVRTAGSLQLSYITQHVPKSFIIHQLMHKRVVLKNNIKIYLETAPTCFGAVTPSSGGALFVLAKVTVLKIVH
jgi:hypothetical protein